MTKQYKTLVVTGGQYGDGSLNDEGEQGYKERSHIQEKLEKAHRTLGGVDAVATKHSSPAEWVAAQWAESTGRQTATFHVNTHQDDEGGAIMSARTMISVCRPVAVMALPGACPHVVHEAKLSGIPVLAVKPLNKEGKQA